MQPRIIFQLVKFFPLLLLLTACHTARAPKATSTTSRLDVSTVASVCNVSYRFEMPEYQTPTILGLFLIQDTTTDNVSLQFDNPRTLRLTYRDSTAVIEKTFSGRFTKKGFKIIFSNERKEIPPFIPIIYGRYNVNKIRLSLTNDNNLVIKKIWNNSGHFLLFGSPYSGTRKSYFTISRPG